MGFLKKDCGVNLANDQVGNSISIRKKFLLFCL